MENEISKKEIRNLISESCPLILDIGCYDGSDGADIAALFGCAEVHCFECDPRSIKLFKEHHSDNSDLFLHEFALGKVNGKIGFYQSDSPTRRHARRSDRSNRSIISPIASRLTCGASALNQRHS